MRKVLIIILFTLIFIQVTEAEEINLSDEIVTNEELSVANRTFGIDPGILPDNFLYGFKRFFEKSSFIIVQISPPMMLYDYHNRLFRHPLPL